MSTFLEKCIYINNNAICQQLCDDIITMFENQEVNKYEGETAGGLNKNIKDTTDYVIPRANSKNENNNYYIQKWSKIDKFLDDELHRNIKEYIRILQNKINVVEENSDKIFKILSRDVLSTKEFMIQRYTKGKGRYVYHNDSHIDWNEKKYRVITYIFYLNTVEEGGETEFFNELRIKPEAGKLVLFPASWLWPHRGMMPKSSNKYIITGWLYLHE